MNQMNDVVLKTKRLILKPMPLRVLRQKIHRIPDTETKREYTEMLEKAEKGDFLWNTPWEMLSREDGQFVGDIGFKGAPQNGMVEIGYTTEPSFRNRGYMSEALTAMLDWAFTQEGVRTVEAETVADNLVSQNLLKKHGFLPVGEGEEGPRFRREKPEMRWMSIYMLLGMSMGMSLGVAWGNIAMGMVLGSGLGLCLGACKDKSRKAPL